MPTNERTQPNDDKMPVDKPGDDPAKRAPVEEPGRSQSPEKDPPTNKLPQEAPTDPDIAKQGHIEASGRNHGLDDQEQPSEPQAIVDAANGEVPVSQVIA